MQYGIITAKIDFSLKVPKLSADRKMTRIFIGREINEIFTLYHAPYQLDGKFMQKRG